MTPSVNNVFQHLMSLRQTKRDVELPAERILAQELGISRRVVREAINELAKADLLVQSMGRKRFIKSRNKQQGKKHLHLGIVLGRSTSELLCNEGLHWIKLMQEDQHHPTVIPLGSFSDREYLECETFPHYVGQLDGVIAIDVWYPVAIQWMESLGCPILSMDHPTNSRHIVDYLPDERRGCKKLAQHFLKKGIKTVHYFDFYSPEINPVRRDAFISAMNEVSISVKGIHHISFEEHKAMPKVKTILKDLKPYEGIFTVSENLAAHIDKYLKTKKPEQLQTCHMVVVSTDLFKSLSGISISGYSRNSFTSASRAYELLLELIHKPGKSRKRQHFPVAIHQTKDR